VDTIITHRFGMSRAIEAVDLIAEHGDQCVGVVINHDE
jgi:threonine dehydrogenase-like Zn-dependent dehydrogenase